jgi:small subunit ribosomal protein S21
MSEVKVEKRNVEKALRKLKKIVDREGTLKEVRDRRFYEKPSRTKYKKRRKALLTAKIQSRENKSWGYN